MLKIQVKRGNIERALKEYKSKIIRTHQIKKLKENKSFEKPSVKNRRVKKKAIYIENKKRED